jgi:hypothetical protein
VRLSASRARARAYALPMGLFVCSSAPVVRISETALARELFTKKEHLFFLLLDNCSVEHLFVLLLGLFSLLCFLFLDDLLVLTPGSCLLDKIIILYNLFVMF